jgi:hypothetical protein
MMKAWMSLPLSREDAEEMAAMLDLVQENVRVTHKMRKDNM